MLLLLLLPLLLICIKLGPSISESLDESIGCLSDPPVLKLKINQMKSVCYQIHIYNNSSSHRVGNEYTFVHAVIGVTQYVYVGMSNRPTEKIVMANVYVHSTEEIKKKQNNHLSLHLQARRKILVRDIVTLRSYPPQIPKIDLKSSFFTQKLKTRNG